MEQRIPSVGAWLIGILCTCTAHAQDLRINRVDGGVELHAIADIRSITFTGPTLNIHYLDGATVARPFDEIRSYAFTDLNTGTGGVAAPPALQRPHTQRHAQTHHELAGPARFEALQQHREANYQ
jgi:hypothetical protein